MLTLLLHLAAAQTATEVARGSLDPVQFEGPIVVTLKGAPVPDAEVRLVDPAGRLVGGPFVTDADGAVVIDGTWSGARHVEVRRALRFADGDRPVFRARVPAAADLDAVALTEVDFGAGPTRATPLHLGDGRAVLKVLKKRRVDVEAACAATLDAASVEEARAAAETHIGALMIAGGSGFEGCVAREWAQAADVERAEQITHFVDAVGGRTSERLWNGLASFGFAEWSFEHGQLVRAQRASGAATERLGGVIGSDAGRGDAEAARALLAQAYQIEASAALIQGDVPAAVSKFHQSLRVWTQLGNPDRMAAARVGIARSELARGRPDAAKEQIAATDALTRTLWWRAAVAHLRASVDADPAVAEESAALIAACAADPVAFEGLLHIGAWWADASENTGRTLLEALRVASPPDRAALVARAAERTALPPEILAPPAEVPATPEGAPAPAPEGSPTP